MIAKVCKSLGLLHIYWLRREEPNIYLDTEKRISSFSSLCNTDNFQLAPEVFNE